MYTLEMSILGNSPVFKKSETFSVLSSENKKPKLICFSIYLLQNEPIMLEKSKFACPFCPKLMPKHSTMKIHIRKHTGEKPYSCNQCNKSYSTNSNLNVHIRDVHGNSPSLKKSEIFQSY
jgi:uncharacterized Zn-finger protein